MNPIAAIKARLAKYPEIRYQEQEGEIIVFPLDESGFAVSFSVAAGEHVVSFSGWHEHFADPQEALNCFAFGLSDQCRLKVSYRGAHAHQWTVESFESDSNTWVESSSTGLLVFPFWRKLTMKYFQNRLPFRQGSAKTSRTRP